MDDKRQRLSDIMNELCSGPKKTSAMRQGTMLLSLVRYHSPYVDASGEHFYLPTKWRHGEKDDNWQECNIDYMFKKDEMNGTDLMRNLRWLGRLNQVLNLTNDNDSEVGNDVDNDSDIDSDLVGHGLP